MTTSTLNNELAGVWRSAPFAWHDDRERPIWLETPTSFEVDARYAAHRRSTWQWVWLTGMTMLRDLAKRRRPAARLRPVEGGFNRELMQVDAAIELYRMRLTNIEAEMPGEDLAQAEWLWQAIDELGKGLAAVGRQRTPLCTGELPAGSGEVVEKNGESLGD